MNTTKNEIIAAVEDLAAISRRLRVLSESTEMYCHMNRAIGKLLSLSRHLPDVDEERPAK